MGCHRSCGTWAPSGVLATLPSPTTPTTTRRLAGRELKESEEELGDHGGSSNYLAINLATFPHLAAKGPGVIVDAFCAVVTVVSFVDYLSGDFLIQMLEKFRWIFTSGMLGDP